MSVKTKFILTYVGGIVTGIVLMYVFALVVNSTQQGQVNMINRNVVMFDEPNQAIKAKTLEVMQVLPNGCALATVGYSSYDDVEDNNYGMVVMFLAKQGVSYFDDQKISVPFGKCLRQVGTYTYESKMGMKTVPVVEIMDI